jgi:hypothetical protein
LARWTRKPYRKPYKHVRCPYCSRSEYVDEPGKALGRCKCGGKRYAHRTDDGAYSVACGTCRTVSEKLSERVTNEYRELKFQRRRMADHVEADHRPRVILDRISAIESHARALHRIEPFTDQDWRDHELAVEYRALMREWWALPAVSAEDVMHSPTLHRRLTANTPPADGEGALHMSDHKDRAVTMDELEAIWADLRARRVCYNGCTHAALVERYGDRVYHVVGEGWYVRPEGQRT